MVAFNKPPCSVNSLHLCPVFIWALTVCCYFNNIAAVYFCMLAVNAFQNDIFDDATLSVLEGKSLIKFIFDVLMLFIH